MIVLGIETSCDETAAALVQNGRKVLRSTVASQLAVHKPFKGVVPELASRAHVERINEVIEQTLLLPSREKVGMRDGLRRKHHPSPPSSPLKGEEVDAIAVTTGPGLIGCLLV